MAEIPAVAAILVNWRMPAATLECVAALRRCGCPDLAVAVIDNGSGDDSVRQLTGAGDFEFQVLEQNVGYCAAINRGVEWAAERGAELVLLLNSDVELPDGFLAPLAEAMRHDPNLACVGPTMLLPDGKVWAQGGALAFAPNFNRLRGQGGPPAPTTAGPVAVDYMPGACALYRVADFRAVGALDESYFMYWEEVDLGERLRARGKKIVWLPWVRIVHHPSATSGGGRSGFRKYASALNSVRWLKRHGRARHWLAFVLFDVLAWPLSWLGGTPPRAMVAKLRGVAAGLCGRRVDARTVDRWLGGPGGEMISS